MALNMCYSIQGSVGAGGANLRKDVEVVQMLLNEHAGKVGFAPVRVTGSVTPETIQAIRTFQQKVVGMRMPDGRVDPSGGTLRKLNEPPTAVARPARSRVSGKTTGVKADIIAYLEAVADHYDKDIVVTSGKRSPEDQARAMWGAWNEHLDRGKIYAYLQQNEDVRKELNGYFVLARETPSASAASRETAKKQFYDKVISIAGQLSRHLTGEAVDVSLSTDAKVLGALKVGFTYVEEKYKGVVKCHHFDIRKFGKAPDPAQHKAQWPK